MFAGQSEVRWRASAVSVSELLTDIARLLKFRFLFYSNSVDNAFFAAGQCHVDRIVFVHSWDFGLKILNSKAGASPQVQLSQ